MDAQSEQHTTLRAVSTFLSLADLKNDNYYKLIAVEIPNEFHGDAKSKLKVFKGAQLISEQGLPGIPSSVQTLHVDDNDPRIPVIAVTIGPSVYFYKNMKPYFKFNFPSLAINPLEKDVYLRVGTARKTRWKPTCFDGNSH